MPRNLLVLVIGTFLNVGVTYVAVAADRAPVYVPPVTPPPYNWSGLYLGVNVGGAWSNRTLSIAGTTWDDPFSTAFIGGFQLGYNLQAGHFLVGVEGDFDWATFGRPSFTVSSPLGPVQFSDRQKWISTVAARFGIASGRWLTSGKLEYDYLRLGDWTTSTVPAVSWRRDTQMIKLGMNYKFQSGNSDDETRTPDDSAGSARAKGRQAGTDEDLAKASQNPIASLVSVPFQNNTNFNNGPFGRTQNVLNIQPVVPMSLSSQ